MRRARLDWVIIPLEAAHQRLLELASRSSRARKSGVPQKFMLTTDNRSAAAISIAREMTDEFSELASAVLFEIGARSRLHDAAAAAAAKFERLPQGVVASLDDGTLYCVDNVSWHAIAADSTMPQSLNGNADVAQDSHISLHSARALLLWRTDDSSVNDLGDWVMVRDVRRSGVTTGPHLEPVGFAWRSSQLDLEPESEAGLCSLTGIVSVASVSELVQFARHVKTGELEKTLLSSMAARQTEFEVAVENLNRCQPTSNLDF